MLTLGYKMLWIYFHFPIKPLFKYLSTKKTLVNPWAQVSISSKFRKKIKNKKNKTSEHSLKYSNHGTAISSQCLWPQNKNMYSVHPWVQLVIYGHFSKVLLRYSVNKRALESQTDRRFVFFFQKTNNFQCLLSLMIKKIMPDVQLWPKNAWYF